MNKKRDEKKVNIVLGCLVLMFITSLPLLTDFLMNATDLQYQLIRIEALKNAIQQYGLHMWAKPEWMNPQGFSFAFFYGDTFLYIPALFRIFGINVQLSYRIFFILINVVTVLISFFAFRKIFKDDYTGLLGSALYSASIYRIFLMYSEAELGEVLALTFLPLIFLGCFLILKEEKKGFIYLALGFTGVLRSHVLSFAIALIFVAIFLIINFRKFAKGAVWGQIGLAVLASLAMNLSYLYTMMRYITCGQFVVNPVSGQAIQAKGIQIAQLFMCFYQAGGSHEFGVNGVSDAVPVGVGFVMLVVILVFCYLLFVYADEFSKEVKANGWKAFSIGAIACILSILCFPWDFILKLSGVTSSLVSMMQAPWHFLQMALLAFSVLGCITYGMMKQKFGEYGKYYGVGLVALTCLSASYLAANMLFTYDFSRIRVAEEIGYTDLSAMSMNVEMTSGVWYVLEAISVVAVIVSIIYSVMDKKKTQNKEK